MSVPEAKPLPRLSAEFERLSSLCHGGVTFRKLLGDMTPRDQALLTLVLSAAFLHPIPMLGTTMPLGVVILLTGARMALGKGPWIPRRWVDHPLPAKLFHAVFHGFAAVMRRVEKVVRPRGRFLAAHPWMRRANGAGLALVGLLVLMPYPPPTNFPPALAGFALSVGILEDDILFIALGWLGALATVAMFIAITVYGMGAVTGLWHRAMARG